MVELPFVLHSAIKKELKNNKNNNTNRKEILILKNKQTRKSIKRKRIIKTMIDDDPQLSQLIIIRKFIDINF